MFFHAFRHPFKMLITLGLATLALGWLLFIDETPIVIESEESKTAQMKPVYNRITWKRGARHDVWLMQQSHVGMPSGSTPAFHQWDRIAIRIDKTTSPKQARFYQLPPGKLEWPKRIQPIEYKASCFLCHTNGPRAIRPLLNSQKAPISKWNQARLFLWNFRIKSYGRVRSVGAPDSQKSHTEVPFRYDGKHPNETLVAKSCTPCHKKSGFFARGELTRQNASTIQFMLSKGYMPPLGFQLNPKDKKAILRFLGT